MDVRAQLGRLLGTADKPTLDLMVWGNRYDAGLKDGATRTQAEARAAQRAHGDEVRTWLEVRKAAAAKARKGTAMARAMRLVNGRRQTTGTERLPAQMRGLHATVSVVTQGELGTAQVQRRDKNGAKMVDRKGKPLMREVVGNRAERRAAARGKRAA